MSKKKFKFFFNAPENSFVYAIPNYGCVLCLVGWDVRAIVSVYLMWSSFCQTNQVHTSHCLFHTRSQVSISSLTQASLRKTREDIIQTTRYLLININFFRISTVELYFFILIYLWVISNVYKMKSFEFLISLLFLLN